MKLMNLDEKWDDGLERLYFLPSWMSAALTNNLSLTIANNASSSTGYHSNKSQYKWRPSQVENDAVCSFGC
jgi:hypothetical protein